MGALSVAPAAGQRNAVDGHASMTIDHLPNAGDATEFRARVFAERGFSVNERLRFRLSGWAEGLLADRDGFVRDAAALPHEAYVEVRAGAFDVRAGLATSVWGRFDEVQPTDVVNPLDVSRYLFEGRSEARLPVLQTRLRWSANEATTVEGLWVPVFRRGRFDALDEPTSPFNLVADARPCSGPFACIQAPTDRATPPGPWPARRVVPASVRRRDAWTGRSRHSAAFSLLASWTSRWRPRCLRSSRSSNGFRGSR